MEADNENYIFLNLQSHFWDYGFMINSDGTRAKQREQNNKRQRDQSHNVQSEVASLVLQAPKSVQNTLKLISVQTEVFC